MLMRRFLDSLTIHHPATTKGWVVWELQRGDELCASASRGRIYFYLDCISEAEASIPVPPEMQPTYDANIGDLLTQITGMDWDCPGWPSDVELVDKTPADPLLRWHERSEAALYTCMTSDDHPSWVYRQVEGVRVLDLRETPDALSRLARP